MGLKIKEFFAGENGEFNLKDFDTDFTGDFDKESAAAELERLKAELTELQDLLYANNQHSLLLIFQAMDAAGKDSAIKHVMSGLNPQGCQVYSFKQPSSEDYEHDFLWRHYKALPEKGRIGIHNRSHYENVLVCKVHPELLLKENRSDLEVGEKPDGDFWDKRYTSIADFEKHLHRNGTMIIKFFLNVSKKEQKERFLERIDDPAKNWKFSSFDIEERRHWDEYMDAYQDAIRNTSTKNSPWYIIPADKKWFARVAVCSIIVETLQNLNLKYPELSEDEVAKLQESREALTGE
ncbi:MAG: polyphosphate--nucleotide phosphotransferase [Sphingobacteriaceae bacterium]|jgi:PPK2 family polyphosphate:nucleotide phosphotransferase|nr:polyphosphate--nucleotide phosphotransferase [Sphingobacteriaceae bacterium]